MKTQGEALGSYEAGQGYYHPANSVSEQPQHNDDLVSSSMQNFASPAATDQGLLLARRQYTRDRISQCLRLKFSKYHKLQSLLHLAKRWEEYLFKSSTKEEYMDLGLLELRLQSLLDRTSQLQAFHSSSSGSNVDHHVSPVSSSCNPSCIIPFPGSRNAESVLKDTGSFAVGGYLDMGTMMQPSLQTEETHSANHKAHNLHNVGGQWGSSLKFKLQNNYVCSGVSDVSLNRSQVVKGVTSEEYQDSNMHGNASTVTQDTFNPLQSTTLPQQIVSAVGDAYGVAETRCRSTSATTSSALMMNDYTNKSAFPLQSTSYARSALEGHQELFNPSFASYNGTVTDQKSGSEQSYTDQEYILMSQHQVVCQCPLPESCRNSMFDDYCKTGQISSTQDLQCSAGYSFQKSQQPHGSNGRISYGQDNVGCLWTQIRSQTEMHIPGTWDSQLPDSHCMLKEPSTDQIVQNKILRQNMKTVETSQQTDLFSEGYYNIQSSQNTACLPDAQEKQLQRSLPDQEILIHYQNCGSAWCHICVAICDKIASMGRPSVSFAANIGLSSSNCSFLNNSKAEGCAIVSKTNSASIEISDDFQYPVKRLKVECSSKSKPATESCFVHVSHETDIKASSGTNVQDAKEYLNFEASTAKIESPLSCVTDGDISGGQNSVNEAKSKILHPFDEKTAPVVYPCSTKKNIMEVEIQFNPVVKNKLDTNSAVDSVSDNKSKKSNIKGVSLMEFFTPEQVKEHIAGLEQWIGQSKIKVEKSQATEQTMTENLCQLCGVEKIYFELTPINCTKCGSRIKKNGFYLTCIDSGMQHCFCIPCFNEVRGEFLVVEGSSVPKAKFEKKKNDERIDEAWVQCDKCEAWQHQICALFNNRKNDGQVEYTCPNCYIQEIKRGERRPLPQSTALHAKYLPRTALSDHIEDRLFKSLKQEREERAEYLGTTIDDVPGGEALVVRVVSSVGKQLEVKPLFLDIFREENYPTEFPYKSKAVLLFQNIEGADVCLFGIYVQEYGSDCQFPNRRHVYVSYLDSVKYFRPDTKAVTGEALRTFVYHEVLIGYLEYCKRRGFTSCYLWVCPPVKGDDYILYCHPEIQKTPKSEKLRGWYRLMIQRATKENIVVNCTNLYDHFFVTTDECKAKVSAARLPYFDGDYWPSTAENVINQLRQEEGGRKQKKRGKTRMKTSRKESVRNLDLSGNEYKDALLTQKLGETIAPMKGDFLMVHLQHACSHCCEFMLSGIRWVCSHCKNFQLCQICHEIDQKRDERDRHPINGQEKHLFNPVMINDVPLDTLDKDGILESEIFDTRHSFLNFCQRYHYQFDTLRRAKHSSMMVLYHLLNPASPTFVTACSVCRLDIRAGLVWSCQVCPEYYVCNSCYHKNGGTHHPHKLISSDMVSDNPQGVESQKQRLLEHRVNLDLLVHASQCLNKLCEYRNCLTIKYVFGHGTRCSTRARGGCVTCTRMWSLIMLHATFCTESDCIVPRCRDLREQRKNQQVQADLCRRAAAMDMVRQEAIEAAGNRLGR